MDNTNNKNVFSLKLFWQTVIQLKVIGFISLAVVAFVSGFPIIIEGLNIKKMINAANAAAAVPSHYPQVYNISLYLLFCLL